MIARHSIRNRAGVVIAAVAALAVVVVVALFLSNSNAPGATSTPSVVAEFIGDGDKTTDLFRVAEGWQIQWENVGAAFSFRITGDTDFGTVIDQSGPGSGVTSPVGAGQFRLEVKAEGGWSIRIVQT